MYNASTTSPSPSESSSLPLNNEAGSLSLPRSAFERSMFQDGTVKQYGSHFVMQDVAQFATRKVLLNLDSQFGSANLGGGGDTLVADYSFSLPHKISGVKTLTLKSVEVPFFCFNVSAYLKNNQFTIGQNTGAAAWTTTLTVPDGNYLSPQSLCAALNSALESAAVMALGGGGGGGGVSHTVLTSFAFSVATVSQTDNPLCALYKIQMTFSPPWSVSASSLSLAAAAGLVVVTFAGGGLGWTLGFRQAVEYSFAAATWSALGDRPPKLTPRYCYVAVDEYCARKSNGSFLAPRGGSSSSSAAVSQNILARAASQNAYRMQYSVYLAAAAASAAAPLPPVITLPADLVVPCALGALSSDTRIYGAKGVDIQRLRVQLLDEYGAPLDVQGLDFSLCLEMDVLE